MQIYIFSGEFAMQIYIFSGEFANNFAFFVLYYHTKVDRKKFFFVIFNYPKSGWT